MTTLGYWAEFPVTYRAEQIATIMQWARTGESGVVVGVSGSGKSNLAGFLSSRPDALIPHVTPEHYFLTYLDVNSLPALTAPLFYRGLAQALQEAAVALGPEIAQAAQQLTESQVNWDDIFAARSFLQKFYHLIIRRGNKTVIWLLDRFDAACLQLDAQTLNSLRSLRDQFKGRLCYLVFTRHPLARLRDPREYDEFHEIVAANTCWLGPMGERDAHWIARQMTTRLGATFSDPVVNRLIEITGGLPAFMKLACLALVEGKLPDDEPAEKWVERLLARPEFQRNCQEIWGDLSPAEQTLLSNSTGVDETHGDRQTLIHLRQAGLLTQPLPGQKTQIFSPILAAFIAQQTTETAGQFARLPQARVSLRNGIPLALELTAHEDRLLTYFLEHPGEICAKDHLIQVVWPEEKVIDGIRDDRLAQLVRRLREKIEPDPAHPVYIRTCHGRGYRFTPPA